MKLKIRALCVYNSNMVWNGDFRNVSKQFKDSLFGIETNETLVAAFNINKTLIYIVLGVELIIGVGF